MPDYTPEEMEELTRMAEADESGEKYESPFDNAARAAQPETDPEVQPSLGFGEIPPARKKSSGRRKSGAKRGRPRSAEKTKPRTSRPRTESVPHVQGPPPPQQAPTSVGAIPAAQLIPLIKRIDGVISERVGTEPLSGEETNAGAEALAPLLHHYMPLALNQPWAPFVAWALLAYGPRMLDRAPVPARSRIPTQPSAAEREANPVDTVTTFSRPTKVETPPAETPPIPADATSPIFRNPLADQPDAPIHRPFGT